MSAAVRSKTGALHVVALLRWPAPTRALWRTAPRRSTIARKANGGDRLGQQSHHLMRHHGRHPHAQHVGRAADHAGADRAILDRGGRGGRGHHPPARARSGHRARPRPTRRCSCSSCPIIKQATGAVLNITTGGGLKMTVEERLAAPLAAQPEMCSLNMGSHELQHLTRPATRSPTGSSRGNRSTWPAPTTTSSATRSATSRRSSADWAMAMARGSSSSATTWATCTAWPTCLDRKVVEPPLFVQTIFGILGGIGAEPRNLMFMRETADRLFGRRLCVERCWAPGVTRCRSPPWRAYSAATSASGSRTACISGAGGSPPATPSRSSKIRRILEELSLEIATPDEARAMLHLKGGDRVGF